MSKGWDSVMLKKLKALTGKGLSTSEIGKRLGMSKNAVVGKLNRLGWNSKAGGVTNTSGAKTQKKTTSKKTVVATTGKVQKKPGIISAIKSAKKAVGKKTTDTKKRGGACADKKSVTSSNRTLNKNLAMHQRIIQHSLEMANLKPNQCRWPIGDPDSENFHFCGEQVFVGKPYCYEHCKQAYQFNPPKKNK